MNLIKKKISILLLIMSMAVVQTGCDQISTPALEETVKESTPESVSKSESESVSESVSFKFQSASHQASFTIIRLNNSRCNIGRNQDPS